jgi:hypothetical protein
MFTKYKETRGGDQQYWTEKVISQGDTEIQPVRSLTDSIQGGFRVILTTRPDQLSKRQTTNRSSKTIPSPKNKLQVE